MLTPSLLSEREAKLQLIISISRSQNALARILDSMADVSACSEETARSFIQQADRMTRFQQAMASMLANIELHRQYTGIPTAPWLNADKVTPLESFTSKQEADERNGA
ncbi:MULTISPECIES: hypothetical protein [Paenibacillus]|uniref:Spore coat protein n=1 Tax=Paenibacillus vini TaxID=1476024 RepID=A0ABQ4MGF7_9BACL|nr:MULTISPECIES: hypothetical protein [Paenibacillus]MBQ4900649.1 hypothetical protein [Paenibacillus sp. Marseille-P2973]MDN4067890.1 hypothetical protein [Paenibacillus vini]GIP55069.1 hypothetical protein J42TS3_41040 [Paenibacillus vini]